MNNKLRARIPPLQEIPSPSNIDRQEKGTEGGKNSPRVDGTQKGD